MQGIPTPLDRRYLVIQIKEDRDGCQAVVPVHPDVLQLPSSILTDEYIAREALSIAREQFETEANAYVAALLRDGYDIKPSLRMNEFIRFDDKWRFEFAPYHEMLAIRWEFGDEQPYEMVFVPTVLINNGIAAERRSRTQAAIEQIEIAPNVTILYNNARASDYMLWPREMMLEYEIRGELPELFTELGLSREACRNVNGWMVEVPVSALCSSYTLNVPQALLLRNWAVGYHNRLLERAAGVTVQ